MNLSLGKTSTAVIIVDLQLGILATEPVPFGKEAIVARAVALGRAFVEGEALVVLTTTDFSPGYADAPKGAADSPWALPPDGLPAGFATLVPEIDALPPSTIPHIEKSFRTATSFSRRFKPPIRPMRR